MIAGEKHDDGFREYVLGFAFGDRDSELILIEKTKPEWQAGKLNGVGGKIEKEDFSTFHAMAREFREETGVHTGAVEWTAFCILEGTGFKMHCFFIRLDSGRFRSIKQTTDEQPFHIPVNDVDFESLPNVPWLVWMALSFKRGEKAKMFKVQEIY